MIGRRRTILAAAIACACAAPLAAYVPADPLRTISVQRDTGWTGTYRARLPAASSPGREVTLELRADGGAVLSTDYLNGRPPVRSMGSWRIAPNGRVALELRGAGGSGRIERIVFRAAGGALTAVEYDRGAWGRAGLVMRRVPASPPRAPLDGTRWEATQVAGVQPAELDRARPTLEFLRGEWRVAGSTGCNRAAGSYARSGATGLSFDPLATTRRACAEPADAVERAYLRALERTRRFASPSRTLVLYDGEGRLLARFRQTAR